MNLIKVTCSFCGKGFLKSSGRINEAKKFGWKYYCSLECQKQARNRKIKKVCGNSNCNKEVLRTPGQLKKSSSGQVFCSRSCAITLHNSQTPKRKIEIRKCNYCNKEFKRGGKIYCSKECKDKAQIITERELLKQIRHFNKKHKRIPLKREFAHYNAARDHFGSWNKMIEAAGFKPNPVMFAKKYTANDGHICDSLAEKIIDDWLYRKKIKHERRVHYPGDTSLTTDFVTKDKWIEFLGLAGVIKKYDRLVKKKRILCKKYNLPLLEIYPKDLFLVNRLAEIIKIEKS